MQRHARGLQQPGHARTLQQLLPLHGTLRKRGRLRQPVTEGDAGDLRPVPVLKPHLAPGVGTAGLAASGVRGRRVDEHRAGDTAVPDRHPAGTAPGAQHERAVLHGQP
ncbi:hypothetical protein ACFQZ0_21825 [Streptomyces erythrogriseus]